ncbi:MAG: hypothetical protein JO336_11605 [Acidobacteriia bacterium]|nr:hypothetical protein [Terriglobia bacterium]
MKRVSVVKIGIVLSAVPVLLWAYSSGPNPGYNGVPTDHPPGVAAGQNYCTFCHTGTALNGGGGSVSVTFPNGMTYIPGTTQHLTVTIADKVQKAWGFQLTARLSSDSTSVAGTFASTDANTQLQCSQTNLSVFQKVLFTSGASQTCPSGYPLVYIEHTMQGYDATKGASSGSGTYQFDWTPPPSNAGNIVIYVAGNAANGDLTPNGDHIYAATYTLTPAVVSGPPVIDTTLGVQNQTSAPNTPGAAVSPGSLVAIYGTNFAIANAAAASIPLSTQLAGVGVTFNGIAAPMVGIAHGITAGGKTVDQINAIVPWEVTGGSVPVVVTVNNTPSAAANVLIASTDPGIFYIGTDSAGINRPLAYNNADNTFAYPLNDFNGNLKCRPVSIASDVLVIWATGLGPVQNQPPDGAPYTNSSGQLAQDTTTATPQVMVGGVQATVLFSGLTQYPSIYQINAKLGAGTPTGSAVPLQIQMNGGTSSTSQLQIAVTN